MSYRWDEEKNNKLQKERGITFNQLIEDGKILKVINNTSINHTSQLELHILYNNYIYKVPFVIESNGSWFLKTAFKNRKLTKFYLK